MKTIEETKAEVMGNIRACMNDHNITISQLAEWAHATEDETRVALEDGSISLTALATMRDHTGDRRALGISEDYVSPGPIDPAVIRLAQTF